MNSDKRIMALQSLFEISAEIFRAIIQGLKFDDLEELFFISVNIWLCLKYDVGNFNFNLRHMATNILAQYSESNTKVVE